MKVLAREPSNTLDRTEIWTVQSDGSGRKFLISVTRPAMPSENPHGLLLTDGNHVVGTAAQLSYFLELGQLAPPSVVVTIGYPRDDAFPSIVARNRDLTPSHWGEWDVSYGKVLGAECPPSGGADAFRRFIVDELKPAIEAECGVDPKQWALAGHSLGGLFSIHTLLREPGAFQRYLAVGSSFWWKKPLLFDLAKAFARMGSLTEVSAYIAAGDLETADALRADWARFMDAPEWQEYIEIMGGEPDIVRDSHDMADILASAPGVQVRAATLYNETHGTAVFAALSQGLRWLNERR